MATVRVSFLFAGERIHRRLNRHSVLSDVPAKAPRVNRAGPGYKVIRLRGLGHTDNMARTRQYFHVATDESRSFPLRLQPGRRTLLALVFPSRVLSTSKLSRSPFLMLSGSMPDDCSALMCRNMSGPPASSPMKL